MRMKYCLAKLSKETLPAEDKVRLLYRALRLRLLTAGMERSHNQELLSYAETAGTVFKKKYLKKYPDARDAEEKRQHFSGNIHYIFTVYYAVEYGNCTVTEKQLEKCLSCFEVLRKQLRFSPEAGSLEKV